jgi:hypothetical protein
VKGQHDSQLQRYLTLCRLANRRLTSMTRHPCGGVCSVAAQGEDCREECRSKGSCYGLFCSADAPSSGLRLSCGLRTDILTVFDGTACTVLVLWLGNKVKQLKLRRLFGCSDRATGSRVLAAVEKSNVGSVRSRLGWMRCAMRER